MRFDYIIHSIIFRYGVINYLESKLRNQYEIANETGLTNYTEIQSLKAQIDAYRKDLALGVKVRSRIQILWQMKLFLCI